MKYKFEIKGHLLECGFCNSEPQWFSKLEKKMFCRNCDEYHNQSDWYDPIDLALNNFEHTYQQELDYHKGKKMLAALDNFQLSFKRSL